jgi:uncharacterized lipoprotein YbaY
MRVGRLLPGLAAALLLAACASHLDLTPEGNPARVLQGEIRFGDGTPLPEDATATVRVVDPSQQPPLVLGLQTLSHLGAPPIAFRVEFQAEDERLRQGLNVEARVSYGGKVRYYNLNRYVVTLGNVADIHRLYVNPLAP